MTSRLILCVMAATALAQQPQSASTWQPGKAPLYVAVFGGMPVYPDLAEQEPEARAGGEEPWLYPFAPGESDTDSHCPPSWESTGSGLWFGGSGPQGRRQ